MKINIIGAGKMGEVYVRNLIDRLGFEPSDIFVFDVKSEKSQILADKYEVNVLTSMDDLRKFPTIITTTTPSHVRVIEQLSDKGVKNIFCEKPLCLGKLEAEKIQKTDANIHVAYLMRFSKAVNFVVDLMQKENLHLAEATSQWGLNFYHNPRPLIGALIDESVHGIDIIAMLVKINQEIEKTEVSAMLTHPAYADVAVQKEAQSFDQSVPNRPDASVFANIRFIAKDNVVPVSVWSSYIMPQQTRRVCGVLSGDGGELAYAFEINFDTENKTKDNLTITNYKSSEMSEKIFACNEKIADETQAFLNVIAGTVPDGRLVGATEASQSIFFTEAIIKSHENGNEWVEVAR